MANKTTNVVNAVVQEMGISADLQAVGVSNVITNDIQLQMLGNYFDTNNMYGDYVTTLAKRIAFEVIKNKLAKNKLAIFKKDEIEFGDTVEEIFVEMAQGYLFNVEKAETELFKRHIPKVLSKFHKINYKTYYPVTVQRDSLKKYFLKISNMESLITKMIESQYSGANYDEYLVMCYMMGRSVLDGHIKNVNVGELTKDTASTIITTMKEYSDDFTIETDLFNAAQVLNKSDIENQYLIQGSKFKNFTSVEVLAKAFNREDSEFMGKQLFINDFSKMKFSRLDELLKDVDGYVPFTQAEITQLSGLHAILMDFDWFMVYPTGDEMEEQWNSLGKYWNYFYHVERIFSSSDFENVVAFTNFDTGVITSATVKLDGDITDVEKNNNYPIIVTTTPLNGAYTLQLTGNTSQATFINPTGTLTVSSEETATNLIINVLDVKGVVKGTVTLTVI